MKLKTLQKLKSEANSKEEVFDTCLLPDPRVPSRFSHKYDLTDYEDVPEYDLYTGNIIKDNSDFAKIFEAKKRGTLNGDIDLVKSLETLNKRGNMDAVALEMFKSKLVRELDEKRKLISEIKTGIRTSAKTPDFYHSGEILEQVFDLHTGRYRALRMVECEDYCYAVYGWNVYFVGIDHEANINYSLNKNLETVREAYDSRYRKVKAYYQ